MTTPCILRATRNKVMADPYCELVTDWEDVEQRENVTCVTCQEKLWACRCEDPDVDEQRR